MRFQLAAILLTLLLTASAAQALTADESAFLDVVPQICQYYQWSPDDLQSVIDQIHAHAVLPKDRASHAAYANLFAAIREDKLEPSEAHRLMVAQAFADYASALSGKTVASSRLTTIEIAAILMYSTADYDLLNRELRSGHVTPARATFTSFLNEALGKLPSFEGLVKRGADFSPSRIAQFQPGFVFQAHEFFSTTMKVDSDLFARPVRLIIHSKTGKNISGFSTHASEQEVLFRAGTKFRVLSVQRGVVRANSPADYEIELEEVVDGAASNK